MKEYTLAKNYGNFVKTYFFKISFKVKCPITVCQGQKTIEVNFKTTLFLYIYRKCHIVDSICHCFWDFHNSRKFPYFFSNSVSKSRKISRISEIKFAMMYMMFLFLTTGLHILYTYMLDFFDIWLCAITTTVLFYLCKDLSVITDNCCWKQE